ncbi:methylenetetrahydrofolate reductase [Actinotalea sp.]|uniref:methylenetetrahydrofolate reductase n=1 Tax=Actinotalea sp. TaxID=1872145 RepID=UPI002D0E6390|nr:methylenetetrahydrofolate reductase [Actinotalea sp.]HQY32816.1 methylenetetrahydrofolate reductase [Actinotalea sp.]HRA51584.1 methylenetetrahydrofolate reductase [Actinotalea sp.]
MTTPTTPAAPDGVAARLRAVDTLGPTLSFELYPPRTPGATEALWRTIPHLAQAAPDFLSITYGASGSSRETSRAVVRRVLTDTEIRPVAHLTCIGSPRDEVRQVAEEFLADGVRDFLALRGDPPAGATDWTPHPQGLRTAAELVALLRDIDAGMGIAAAASPAAVGPAHEVPGARLPGDLLALKAKQAAGAQYAITQVFFEVETYTRYLAVARAAGVHLPLLPGIVPLDDPARLRRLQEISGVVVPSWILDRLDAEGDETRRRAAGAAMGAELAQQVLAAGAPGLHLYTFNQHAGSLALLERLRGGTLGRRPVGART